MLHAQMVVGGVYSSKYVKYGKIPTFPICVSLEDRPLCFDTVVIQNIKLQIIYKYRDLIIQGDCMLVGNCLVHKLGDKDKVKR